MTVVVCAFDRSPSLSIPITVWSERQFSAAGRLETKLPSILDQEREDMLIFLHENMERVN